MLPVGLLQLLGELPVHFLHRPQPLGELFHGHGAWQAAVRTRRQAHEPASRVTAVALALDPATGRSSRMRPRQPTSRAQICQCVASVCVIARVFCSWTGRRRLIRSVWPRLLHCPEMIRWALRVEMAAGYRRAPEDLSVSPTAHRFSTWDLNHIRRVVFSQFHYSFPDPQMSEWLNHTLKRRVEPATRTCSRWAGTCPGHR